MFYPSQDQGFPISVTFLTKFRTLTKEEINSKTTFNNLIENFLKNSKYKSQAKPKNRYIINGKEIRKNQTLEEIISQNMSDPFSSELFIEFNDNLYSGDEICPIYTKILKPKTNPFGLFVYSSKNSTLSLKSFPEKTVNLFELDKINEGSAYCNSEDDLYISGSKENDNKSFWIINNKDFNIKKKNMPFSKQNHSMIYLNFNENEEWIFIIGGDDKKTFYYDLNKNYFINWGDTINKYSNPALMKIGEYLYIFDSINNKKNYFERTKLINPTRKWEKVIPSIDKRLVPKFPSEFGLSNDINGNILFIGGNNITNSNNTYIYNPIKNEITLSQNGTNDNMIFSDKIFYKLNNKYNIAFPKNVEEKKEICLVDKDEQSLIKVFVEIPSISKEAKVKSKINFNDKKYLINKNDKDSLTIKSLDNKGKNLNYRNMNNIVKQNFISSNYNQTNDLVCNACHRPLTDDNFTNNEYNQNIRKEYPYIEKIHDEYYPTYDKKYGSSYNRKFGSGAYGHSQSNGKVKVQIIYDEYTPIKVNYELGKPYVFKYKATEKKEIEKKEETINKEEIQKNNIIEQDQQQVIEERKEKNELLISNENQENKEVIENQDVIEGNNENQENKEVIENQKVIEENKENPLYEDQLEPYINEEENVEKENEEKVEEYQNEEEHDENLIEEKNEENNEQIEEENNEQIEEENGSYKQYHQKNKEEIPKEEILRDSLEIEEENKEKEIVEVKKEIKEDDDIIKPMLKLDFGFKGYNDNEDEDYDIIRGMKLNFDDDKAKCEKHNDIVQNIEVEQSNDLVKEENQENILIKEENENINEEENNEHIEEEVKYENNEIENENEENGMDIEDGEEEHYEHAEEINFEEDGEEMRYEEENINEIDQENNYEEEGNDAVEYKNDDNNENQIDEDIQEMREEFKENHDEEN